jgi:Uma2 family endonuclease
MEVTTVSGLSFAAYRDLVAGSDDRYELINGELKRVNPPKTQHFFIAKFLERAIEAEIERAGLLWVCFQGAGVRTGLTKARLPDVMAIERAAALDLWQESAIFEVTPCLVIEIVSPSSEVDDYRYKRSEYGAIEVPEYWIVDPLAGRVVVLVLVDGFYEESVFTGDDRLVSGLLPGFAATAAMILSAGSV